MSKEDYISLVLQATDFIEENIDADISVSTVAGLNTLSSWHFQRVFKAYLGETIGDYLRGRRLTLAAEKMMQSPELRLLDVALNYQFSSQEAFTRAFKSHFGLSPTNFRTSREIFKTLKKPRVTREMLEHFQNGLQREPRIETIDKIHLVGIQDKISSPFVDAPDYPEIAPKLFEKFSNKRREIGNRIKGISFGVMVGDDQTMMESSLNYLAMARVPEFKEIPKDMVSLTLEPQLYAVFENVGTAEKTRSTLDYIYGIWLQSTKYSRAPGYDFELFDQRYRLNDPLSISEYYVPIIPN